MKNSQIGSLVKGKFQAPVQSEKDSAQKFRPKGENDHTLDEVENILPWSMGEQILHDHPVSK